ncbi:hypothetical protein PUNSTDRAFT_50963 [Punctularia strigosozonata HHB-11173 SS5]|uniref:uncharacterized protein n=1 Tax=Punctularia strigosozonata (strain HHB-11173) TaxID=741275 RepID=UPI0004416420|nr:uncharacterized protein PUNSTDRAFT_50963 [Punctularia strigosozonata HHB-11173 SS5]EIN10300.1 hypothetical protein PUNSTDRAFT_50963 [Punctularia strigosozonata HHB-11173 SS5]
MLPPPEVPSRKQGSGAPIAGSSTLGAHSQGMISRRLSRSIHMQARPTASSASSRSTSRSRSPMPPTTQPGSFSEVWSQQSAGSGGAGSGTISPNATRDNRRSSRVLVDDPVDPIMSALYAIIGVATDIQDMSVAQLTANPKVCEALVQRVQAIGRMWDEHPDWHGRNWYVQVLLAVASLSRVVEWWEAEKNFWNFDDEGEEKDEPLAFVMKPAEEERDEERSAAVEPTPTAETEREKEGVRAAPAFQSGLLLAPEEAGKLRMSRTTSQGRRSREDVAKAKDLQDAIHEKEQELASRPYSAESARVLATERLRLQAETAQNRNIVMELDQDGDKILWVNYAWAVVVGTEPEEVAGTKITRMLAPSDWHVFTDACRRLDQDDSHTVEVKFRMLVYPPNDDSNALHYQPFEGKGMLMVDRETGHPSHTMWVIKPIGPPEDQPASQTVWDVAGDVTGDAADESMYEPADEEPTGRQDMLSPVTPFPFARPVNTQPILCRICECNVPQWYFEKHNETCVEVHRLEAEIAECNESIAELRNTIRGLTASIDRSPSPANAPEYRGMPILSPSSSPNQGSPLRYLSSKLQRLGIKKMQRRVLEQLEDILQLAAEVSIPALKEDESKEPIERQRLLSPSSERKMTQIRNWSKPSSEDAALTQLLDDAERVMRQKLDNVVRMQNTIRYTEKVRQEWEERVMECLSTMGDVDEEESDESEYSDQGDYAGGYASSTKSEYAFNGEEPEASSEPTPLAVTPPILAPSEMPTQTQPIPLAAPRPGPPPPPPPPPPMSRTGASLATRSSTPSSVSSPLALVPPIVASPSPPPPINLDEGTLRLNTDLRYYLPELYPQVQSPGGVSRSYSQGDVRPSPDMASPPRNRDDATSTRTIRSQKSSQSLQQVFEPRSMLTPPMSPLVSPRDVTVKKHRRQSTAHNLMSPTVGVAALSPRLPAPAPMSRTTPTSIKDFEIIKPISKGAFGSVFLAKKKATGDYFAIKVLKKADMIAKNQVTNVKAERMILMKQSESPFVAKLYFTFQSKENLYLVMEYLNGGDCAALIKVLGCLPEEWTKNYIAEVVLGLESLHRMGIVHRDLKPDNLLIDQHGHLKLTDFGLSRIGLLGRQTRDPQVSHRPPAKISPGSRPPSIDMANFSSPMTLDPASGSYFSQRTQMLPRLGSTPYLNTPTDDPDSSGSTPDSQPGVRRAPRPSESPLTSFATELTTDLRSHSNGTPPAEQRFVGTPDYLAPETILGLRGDDAAVDWWALGVITYEFLYGIPPFHADSPGKVFENILSGNIEWHEDLIEYSPEARDFMQRLLTLDPSKRLGTNGADEVKAHPWFSDIVWDQVTTREAAFIPQITDPESTDYFDPRGAINQMFDDDDLVVSAQNAGESPSAVSELTLPAAVPVTAVSREASGSPGDDSFGTFNFKNLPVLKQANDEVIRKLRTDQMAPIAHALSESSAHSRRRSISHRVKKPPSVVTTFDPKSMPPNPPSPATSTSSVASSPSRASLPPSTPGSATSHARKPSEYSAIERFKHNQIEGEGIRRPNSMPSRLRTASVSTSSADGSVNSEWPQSSGQGSSHFEPNTPPSSVVSIDLRKAPDPSDRAVTCLLAEDNPITAKILETLLIRLGCRCVVVADGSEAISVAMGDIKFDIILMDLHMPVLDGEGAARYIKSTNGKNTNTPIVAVSAYSGTDPHEASNLFAASLAKPVQKADILNVFRRLGFKTAQSTTQGKGAETKVTPVR